MPQTDKSIIITYHYIQQSSDKPRLKGLLVEDFEKQIKLLLENNYKIVTLGKFLESYKKGLADSEKFAVLTFDDGLKDHAVNVLPVFQKYGVGGTFFVITRPLKEIWMASVHQLHFILATAPVRKVKYELEGWLKENSIVIADLDEKTLLEQAKKFYIWDETATACIKYLLNVQLEEPVRSAAIGHLFDMFVGPWKKKAPQFYLEAEDLRKIRSLGMEIGSHTHGHPILAFLSESEQKKEVSLSKKVLEEILDEEVNLFSYPYGTPNSFSEATIEFLKISRYRAAVTTNQDYVSNSTQLFTLNRIDTNEVRKYLQ